MVLPPGPIRTDETVAGRRSFERERKFFDGFQAAERKGDGKISRTSRRGGSGRFSVIYALLRRRKNKSQISRMPKRPWGRTIMMTISVRA